MRSQHTKNVDSSLINGTAVIKYLVNLFCEGFGYVLLRASIKMNVILLFSTDMADFKSFC